MVITKFAASSVSSYLFLSFLTSGRNNRLPTNNLSIKMDYFSRAVRSSYNLLNNKIRKKTSAVLTAIYFRSITFLRMRLPYTNKPRVSMNGSRIYGRRGERRPGVTRCNYYYLKMRPGAKLKMDLTSKFKPENSCRAARVAPCIVLVPRNLLFFFSSTSLRRTVYLCYL